MDLFEVLDELLEFDLMDTGFGSALSTSNDANGLLVDIGEIDFGSDFNDSEDSLLELDVFRTCLSLLGGISIIIFCFDFE